MRVRLRDRGLITLLGLGMFWGSGFAFSSLYLTPDRPMVMCTNTGTRLCMVAFVTVVIAAVGFWIAIIAGTTFVVGVIQRYYATKKGSGHTPASQATG